MKVTFKGSPFISARYLVFPNVFVISEVNGSEMTLPASCDATKGGNIDRFFCALLAFAVLTSLRENNGAGC
ncbi:hypothetical protein RRG08_060721 [Elysia crispata]|uniref:Uncharacterized protein n=1 Tax=Elysia crispata TaxID=231223 RepID=A0AAE0XND5_9GAST|nr:hypothetical protein RRG08_060721 [Elysia crispata]